MLQESLSDAMTNYSSSHQSDDEILAQIIRGWDRSNMQPSDIEIQVRRHPHLETQIRDMYDMCKALDDSRPARTLPIPQQLGEFRIVRQLETGGMGEVYESWHERLKRRVAVKVLRHGQRSKS